MPNPLKSLIFGSAGKFFCPNSHHNRYRQRFQYYLPSGRKRYGAGTEPRDRFRANEFDVAVFKAIGPYVPRTIDRARTSHADIVHKLVGRIDVGPDEMVISLRTGAIVEAPVACRVRSFTWRNGARALTPSGLTPRTAATDGNAVAL